MTDLGVDIDSLPNPDLTDNAREVLNRRYLIRDKDGNVTENPKDMFWRVAKTIASVDEKYGASREEVKETAIEFYNMMSQGYWLPNSPTLTGAGRELGMLSACFVLPVEDCISNGQDGIFDTVTNAALIWQAGGGTGYSFSRLRPNGSMVKSTTGIASGPVSFMEIYNTAVDTMKQGGHRRGAQMAILRVDHPDIMEFISCKSNTDNLTNFNISVAITDEFMEALQSGEEYDLYDPRYEESVGSIDAQEVFDSIVERAHATGEPGLFFIDEANRWNEVPSMGEIEATNPCGEIPMPPYSACNLGSLNLSKFVTKEGTIDWTSLMRYASMGTHFLDNVIDANEYPLQNIRDRSDRERRIGAGVMGWADMLIKLGIPYDSDEALELADSVARVFYEVTVGTSESLAKERGVFPEWEDSIWGPHDDRRPMRKVRNASLTTIAPTGTISIIAGCSGGIEPIYAVGFMRNQAGAQMPDIHRDFSEYVEYDAPITWKESLIDSGSLDHDWVKDGAKKVFRTSSDVSPERHIRMQAVWQPYITQAISKTINFPKEATPEDVREGYLLAHELGCKGVTVYRDGSRPGQVLSTGKTEDSGTDLASNICPECEGELINTEGCVECRACNWSKCNV